MTQALPCAAQDEMTRIQNLLQQGFRWLLFPQDLEQTFLKDLDPARRRHILLSGLIALLIFNGFLLADYLMLPDVFWQAFEIRVLVFTPAALLILGLFWRAPPLVQRLSPHAIEVIVMVSGLGAAACLAYILASTHSQYGYLYHVGFMVVIMYGNVVQRLRFWYAVIFSTVLVAIHIGGVLSLPAFPTRMMLPIMSLVCASAAFTLTACYFLERDERRRYLLTVRERLLIRELTAAQARLRELSQVDELTGLSNRRHFQEQTQQLWQRAQFEHGSIGLLMLDVDHFKKFNDHYGHPRGDECLRRVAAVLKGCVTRQGGLVARYGGEEFIAVLPGLVGTELQTLADAIRHGIEALGIEHGNSSTANVVTASLGAASCTAHPDLVLDSLLTAADAALYAAKASGRNRVVAQGL